MRYVSHKLQNISFKNPVFQRSHASRLTLTTASALSLLLLAGCQNTGDSYKNNIAYLTYADYTYGKNAKSAVPITLVRPATFHEDCSSGKRPEIKVLVAPSHGTLSFQNGRDYQNLEVGHPRYHCRGTLMDSKRVIYRSHPGFHGQDTTVFKIVFGPGRTRTETVILSVN